MPGDTTKTRTTAQIEHNRAEIATRYLRGESQATIAAYLHMTQQMVSYDLQRIQERWQAAALRDFDAARAQELAKVDDLEREYWAAWERSKVDFTSRTMRARGAVGQEKPNAAEQTTRTEQRDGNPAYLTGVMNCIERRCKLLGLDAPEVGLRINWDVLSVEQIERLARGESPRKVLYDR